MKQPAVAPSIGDKLEEARKSSKARACRSQHGAVSVQPHTADRQGLAEPRRLSRGENAMRCTEHYHNQKRSITEGRPGHPWQPSHSFPQQRCRQTQGQHKLLQVVPPPHLSWHGESILPLPPDSPSSQPLMDTGTFQTTTGTPRHTQSPPCFPIN